MPKEHKPTPPNDSILLTHWDPHCYEPNADPPSLVDLALSALLHQQVLVRAVDLFVNPFIGKKLWEKKDEDLILFEEMLDYDCLKLISTKPIHYEDARLQDLADKSPISARVQDQLGRGLAGKRWRPDGWVSKLCAHLDGTVKSRNIHYAAEPKPENTFAIALANVLRSMKGQDVSKQFSGIDPVVAEKFIEFCTKPGYWKDFLIKEKKADPDNISDRQDFFRTEAYQCAKYFGKTAEESVQNLVQSVYMSLECDREDAAGRFGRKLWEPPLGFSSGDEEERAKDLAVRLEVRPLRRSIPIMLKPGLGKALAETRESREFRSFQKRLMALDEVGPLAQAQTVEMLFGQVADRFAEEASQLMVHKGKVEHYVAHGAEILGHAAGHAAAVVLGFSHPETLGTALVAGKVCSRAGAGMTHVIRSKLFENALSEKVRDAVKVRTSRIKL